MEGGMEGMSGVCGGGVGEGGEGGGEGGGGGGFFFFNDTATTEIYTLSLHDALPISLGPADARQNDAVEVRRELDLRIGMNHFLLVHRMYTITTHTRSLRLLCV